MEKELFDKLNTFMNENKGKRKFAQSVDLIVNFREIDFSKPDNRLNMSIKLPKGKGRESKIMLFTDDKNVASKAESAGVKVVTAAEIPTIANDKKRLNELLNYELLAQPALMPLIAKGLGQFLGPRNKMPKPIAGSDIQNIIKDISSTIYIKSKGKYLPTVHCSVGVEKMSNEDLAENIDEVINTFAKKFGKLHIKSVYVKLTMSKPLRLL
ncbi:MAG: 50S ribosomal protein L1 [Candidatus Micrarchaeia archaeon]